MCVVALALNQHPDWPILLAGNRDEFHGRASAPLAEWDDNSGILAGRDLVGGGTWLGVQPQLGRIVVVTNVANGAAPDPAKQSRGELVRGLLTGDGRYADPVSSMLDDFNGFNLMQVTADGTRQMTNRPEPLAALVPRGVHSLANRPVGAPCPRADRLTSVMCDWLARSAAPTMLLDALTDGADPALFVRGDVYGTRCSTLVAVDAAGAGHIIERRYDKGGNPVGETALSFVFG